MAKGATKYSRAADNNLKAFMGLIGGSKKMEPASEDEYDYANESSGGDVHEDSNAESSIPPHGSEEGSSSEHEKCEEEVARDIMGVNKGRAVRVIESEEEEDEPTFESKNIVEKKGGKSKSNKSEPVTQSKAKRKEEEKAAAFKSKEMITDSDDEDIDASMAHGESKVTIIADNEDIDKSRKKGKSREKDVETRVESAKIKDKAGAPSKTVSSPDEERIKKLKALLVAFGGNIRAFNATTGAEKSLSTTQRIDILESALAIKGLTVKSTIKYARELGAQKALEKELSDISQTPVIATALRGRPKRLHDDSMKDGVEQKKPQQLKKFAFLGDQSDSSE